VSATLSANRYRLVIPRRLDAYTRGIVRQYPEGALAAGRDRESEAGWGFDREAGRVGEPGRLGATLSAHDRAGLGEEARADLVGGTGCSVDAGKPSSGPSCAGGGRGVVCVPLPVLKEGLAGSR
jgi:hypothetical protein